MFFEGGAWLQFRETPDGRVHEEMFDADGEEIQSFNAEIEHDDGDLTELYDPPEAYLRSAVEQYEKYTVRGIRIRKPHHPRRPRRRSLTDHVSHTTICVIGDHPGHWGGSHASRVHVCRPKAKRLRRWYSKNYHGAVG